MCFFLFCPRNKLFRERDISRRQVVGKGHGEHCQGGDKKPEKRACKGEQKVV